MMNLFLRRSMTASWARPAPPSPHCLRAKPNQSCACYAAIPPTPPPPPPHLRGGGSSRAFPPAQTPAASSPAASTTTGTVSWATSHRRSVSKVQKKTTFHATRSAAVQSHLAHSLFVQCVERCIHTVPYLVYFVRYLPTRTVSMDKFQICQSISIHLPPAWFL